MHNIVIPINPEVMMSQGNQDTRDAERGDNYADGTVQLLPPDPLVPHVAVGPKHGQAEDRP